MRAFDGNSFTMSCQNIIWFYSVFFSYYLYYLFLIHHYLMRYGGCNDINVGYIGRHKRPIRIIIRKLQIVSVDLKQTYVEVLVVGAEVEGGEPLCICNGRTHSVETQAGHHRRKTTSSPGRCWRFARFLDDIWYRYSMLFMNALT